MLFVGVGAKMLQEWSSARTARRVGSRSSLRAIVDHWHPSKTGNSPAWAVLWFGQPKKVVEDCGVVRRRRCLRSSTFYTIITFILTMFICVYIII